MGFIKWLPGIVILILSFVAKGQEGPQVQLGHKHLVNKTDSVRAQIEAAQGLIQEGRYDIAIRYLNGLIPFCKGEKEEGGLLSLIYNYTGSAYLFKGEIEQSVLFFTRAADQIKAQPEQYALQLIRIYNNHSVALNRVVENREALRYLEKAEVLAKRYGYVGMLPGIYINKGRIFKDNRQWKESEQQFGRTLSLLDTAGNIEQVVGLKKSEIRQIAYTNLGQLYLEQARPEKALHYLLKGNALLSENSNPYNRIPNYLNLGDVYLNLGNYVLAEKYLLMGLSLASETGVTEGTSEASQSLSQLYARTKDYEQAYRYHVDYARMEDSIRGLEKTKELRQLEMKYRMAEKDKEIAESKLRVTEHEQIVRNRNGWILFVSMFALFVTVLLLVIFRSYRQRRRIQTQEMQSMEKDRQIAVMKATMEGEEKERSRIAGGLHDGIGSIISSAKMNFSTLELHHISNIEVYRKGMVLLDHAATELRSTAHNLMPEILREQGLKSAVSGFCERAGGKESLEIECQFSGDFSTIDKEIQLLAYRCIQELVNNIIKHAGADKALVQLNYADHWLTIAVEDNGKGLDGHRDGKGTGLRNLRKKISMLNGHMSVESEPDGGTQVYIELEV